MQMYHFVTNWYFDAPIEQVWDEIVDAPSWPRWWPSYREARSLSPGSALQIGSRSDNNVRGKLPYSLRFTTEITELVPPHRLALKSSGGLVGTGRFVLEERDGGTAVTYYWDVGTANPALNLLSKLPFIRAMMEDNHDYVMDEGYLGLKQRLEKKPDSFG